jgi:hypothetical protein
MSHSTSPNEHGPGTSSGVIPATVRAGAFWLAVLLPFASLGMLLTGLDSTVSYLLFLLILVANAAALVLGHGYGQ